MCGQVKTETVSAIVDKLLEAAADDAAGHRVPFHIDNATINLNGIFGKIAIGAIS